MSSLVNWWRIRSSREKTMLLVLLICLNATLFYHLNNGDPFASRTKPSAAPAPIDTAVQPPALIMPQKTVAPIAAATASLRDPFRPPAGTGRPADLSAPAADRAISTPPAAAVATPRASKPAAPVLTGIMTGETGKKLAIVEYDGSSRYYGLYDAIGSFNVTAITADSITLAGSNGSMQLTLRR